MVTDGNHETTSMETDRSAHYHERRFRALVEHSMDIIALVNTQGLITANRARKPPVIHAGDEAPFLYGGGQGECSTHGAA